VIALKAIIVDFDGDYLIVANSRGDFKRIYNNYPGCQIGDEITVKENRAVLLRSMLSSKKVLTLAACLLCMLITSYGIYGYMNPVTYVTVDINPSVEFSLNRYDVVRGARGLNEEGKIIIGDGREYKNMKFDKALNLVLSKAVERDFLNKDANTVMLTVSNVKDSISSDKKKQLEEIAKTQLSNIIEKEEKVTPTEQQKPDTLVESSNTNGAKNNVKDTNKSKFKVIVEDTTYKKHQEAKKKEVSQGKLLLYEKLKQVKPDAALSHVKEASVSQILREIEKVKQELKDKSEARPNGNSSDKRKPTDEDKKQQLKNIKQLENSMNKQLKDIQKENKDELKEKIKETKEQLKNYRKEIKDNVSREIKKELKDKEENINKSGQRKNNPSDKKNDKRPRDFKNEAKTKNRNKNNKN